MVVPRWLGDLERHRQASHKPNMRCYSVLLEARLTYHFVQKDGEDQPRGYFATRYVFANNPADAFRRAQRLEHTLLEKEWTGIREGSISATYGHEEIETAPFWRLLRRRYGRTFYETE